MKKRTAIIQVRVSSKRQADKELPIDSQIERCRAKAASLNADVVKVFTEQGKSAFYSNRPGFDEAIDYCEKNYPDYFITWSTSRFSRTQSVSVHTRHRLEKAGVEIVYASFDAGADPDTRFLNIGIRELMDEYSSRQTSKDTRRSMERNAKLGFFNGGKAPYGYKVVEVENKKKKLFVNDEEKKVVEKIFNLRLEGKGARAIAQHLNDVLHETNRSLRWNKYSVSALLRNHAVIGCIVYGRKDKRSGRRKPKEEWVIVKGHDPIIDEVTFKKVQAMMDEASTAFKDTGSPLSVFLFTGLLKCGECGASMQIETARGRVTNAGKISKYNYYNCRGHLKHSACPSRRVPAELVDNFILDVISNRVFSEENLMQFFTEAEKSCLEWDKIKRAKANAVQKEIDKLVVSNDRLVEAIENVQDKEVDPVLLIKKINNNQDQITRLYSDMDKINEQKAPKLNISKNQLSEVAAFLLSVIKTSQDPRKTRNFLQIVLDKVILQADKLLICYRPDMLTATKKKFLAEVEWLPGTGSNCRPSD